MMFSNYSYNVLFLLIGVALSSESEGGAQQQQPQQVSKGAEFEAIRHLHKQMDDDLSGAIDLNESLEFVQEEMSITDATARQTAFLAKDSDSQITLDEMWNRWRISEEHNWTNSDVITWLTYVVELPQYSDSFTSHQVSGLDLPKLAVTNLSYIVGELGVTSPVHRQKIAIKSMDIVLFGHKAQSRVKDYILGSLVTILLSVAWFYTRALRLRDVELRSLQTQMESIQSLEVEMKQMKEQSGTYVEKDQEVSRLKTELVDAQKKIKHLHLSPLPVSSTLRQLLITTYQKEHLKLEQEWKNNMQELNEAKNRLERKSKKMGVMSQMLAAYSSGNDALDLILAGLKTKFDATTQEYRECHDRWKEIEKLSSLTIISEAPTSIAKSPEATMLKEFALRRSNPPMPVAISLPPSHRNIVTEPKTNQGVVIRRVDSQAIRQKTLHEAQMIVSKSESNFNSSFVQSGISTSIESVPESNESAVINNSLSNPALSSSQLENGGGISNGLPSEPASPTDELRSLPATIQQHKSLGDIGRLSSTVSEPTTSDVKKKKFGFGLGKKKVKAQ